MNWTPHDVARSYADYKRRQQAKACKRRISKQRGRPPRIWTPGMLDDLRNMASNGKGSAEIAKLLGLNRRQVLAKACALKITLGGGKGRGGGRKKKAPQDGSPSEAIK